MPILWRKRCRGAAAMLLAMGCLLLGAVQAGAEVPYDTFAEDAAGRKIELQHAYVPEQFIHIDLSHAVIAEQGTANISLKNPEDLFINAQDYKYIADTGNNRILVLDKANEPVQVIGDGAEGLAKLSEPTGLFVDQAGMVYVADTKNRRIAVFHPDGTFDRQYERPDSIYLPDTFLFEPTKLVVDERGYMYVATRNGYEGLLLLDPEGQFQGFFGANRVEFSLADTMKRMFFTEEQLKKEVTRLPGSVTNAFLGTDGFIYTTSISVKRGQLKKLNYYGKDMLGNQVYGSNAIVIGQERLFMDIAVDKLGNIAAVDAQLGIVYQYNALGELMFAFGARDSGYQKLGLFKYPSSIAIDSLGKIYVLDRGANLIHVFRATEFAEIVHEANHLFLQGRYEESEGPWQQVLAFNSKYDRAYLGIAKAHYKKRDWAGALDAFRDAGSVSGYSEAYWQLRNVWMQQHFAAAAAAIAALAAIALIIRSRIRARHAREVQQYES